MANQPDNTRQHEAELSAALLLLGRRYDLPAIIHANWIKPRPFRRIAPTEALRADLAAPYFDIIRAWRAERESLLAAYAALLPARGARLAPGAAQAMQRAVDASALRIEVQLARIDREFARVLANLDRWHRSQWISRVKVATGLDVAMLTTPEDTRAEIANGAAVNVQLAGSVHAEAKGRIGSTLMSALLAGIPAASVATSLNGGLDASRARAARIAVDQSEKTVGGFTRARATAAGLSRFRWHHTPQPRPRPEHLARDRRVYTNRNAPNDRAGMLPFCKCWEEPLWD